MDIKKILLGFATLALLFTAAPQSSFAQWSIGGSYEIRDVAPENGFGLHLERAILQKLPIVDLGLRAHFSYFNEKNSLSYNDGSASYSYSRDITNYDYGLAAVGGVSVGLVSPYVGLGLGSTTLDVNRDDLPQDWPYGEEESDSAIYWNGFIGAKVSPIPMIKPFVEYRFQQVGDFEELKRDFEDTKGRIIFGVSLQF